MSDGTRWCSRDLFVTPIYYALVVSEAAYYEECASSKISRMEAGTWLKHEDSHATTTFLADADGDLFAIVSLNLAKAQGRTGVQIAGLLVHEAVHIFQRTCDRIGEVSPGSEFQAYAIQRIAQELMGQYIAQVDIVTKDEDGQADHQGA